MSAPVRAACFVWQDKRGRWYADEKHPMHLGVNLTEINGPWQLPYNAGVQVNELAEFEKWAKGNGWSCELDGSSHRAPDTYRIPFVDAMHIGWQARAALAARQEGERYATCPRRDAEWMPCNCGPHECQERETIEKAARS